MYLPAHFAEERAETLQRLIADYPLGALVTLGTDGLSANHIPFELDAGAGPHGTLRGHVARGNRVWEDFSPEHEVLVIFGGPRAYISPNWYPTKAEAHRVVPTYNYAVVHAHGKLVVHDDEKWLRATLGRLTKTMESPQPKPWKMGDAPQDYLREMIAGIVGIEIVLSRLVGKWKVSQNRQPGDREGAARGLREAGGEEREGMAALIADTASGDSAK